MPHPLPTHCDVLVVGAGPAGSACAQWLAHAGHEVVLVDQHDFPRDKVCGDGLIPDAHAALKVLRVHDEVMARAQRASHVACIGPRGGRVEVPGALAVLPRRELDDILCRAAVAAGARLFTPWRFQAPMFEADRNAEQVVVGAQLSSGAQLVEVRARWVVLATGAVPAATLAAGVCERQRPSGIALRGYVKNEAMAGRLQALEVVWHRKLAPGYGWIFPCRDGVFNIGVGSLQSHRRAATQAPRDFNLREVFKAFTEFYAPARELMQGGTLQGEMKGAPLRCTLQGAKFSRPGLLVTGEAAGSTYAFSGEGIGKAMETGLAAARALIDGLREQHSDARVRGAYEAALVALKPRFDLYEQANSVNEHPWLADLVIWRARKSARVMRRIAGVLDETANPGNLVSPRGLMKLFVPIR